MIATVRPRDNGGVWGLYGNMDSGFDIRIYTIDPATGIMTAADEGAMVQVNW